MTDMARTPGEEGVAAARLEAAYDRANEGLREAEAAGDALMIGVWLDLVVRRAAELRALGMLTTDRPPDEELLGGED
jgi:hypothetical protein